MHSPGALYALIQLNDEVWCPSNPRGVLQDFLDAVADERREKGCVYLRTFR